MGPYTPYGTLHDQMGPYGTMQQDNAGPLGTIWNKAGPCETLRDHVGPCGTMRDHGLTWLLTARYWIVVWNFYASLIWSLFPNQPIPWSQNPDTLQKNVNTQRCDLTESYLLSCMG